MACSIISGRRNSHRWVIIIIVSCHPSAHLVFGLLFPDGIIYLHTGMYVGIAFGSFCVKSPNELNPTVSDFNETWYTCCLGTHSIKSKTLGQSDQWCGRYGPPNFASFGKNGHGCQPLNPHISGTSDPIFIKLVLMEGNLTRIPNV